ncbi:MAG: hypothetical protein KDK70_27085 [Myxococcales bacterium]|nr:hypothetical protein [Myxococcales bacterium]
MHRRLLRLSRACALVSAVSVAGGCMSLSPQLRPTDFAELETISDRGEREQAYADHAIYTHDEPQGTRYTKGTSRTAIKRSWQSLDAILRSDASASAALPTREMRISRLFTALTVVAGILTVAGTAASAREGLDLHHLNGTGAVLLGGGLATVGFGITAGIFYGKTKKGYERAVAVYNDSLAVRLGLNTAAGDYIPPAGVLVDQEGFIVLDERERALEPAPEAPGANPEPGGAQPEAGDAPALPSEEPPVAAEPEPEPATPEPEAPTPVRPAPIKVAPTPARPAPTSPTPGTGTGTAAPWSGEALDLRPR